MPRQECRNELKEIPSSVVLQCTPYISISLAWFCKRQQGQMLSLPVSLQKPKCCLCGFQAWKSARDQLLYAQRNSNTPQQNCPCTAQTSACFHYSKELPTASQEVGLAPLLSLCLTRLNAVNSPATFAALAWPTAGVAPCKHSKAQESMKSIRSNLTNRLRKLDLTVKLCRNAFYFWPRRACIQTG